MRLQNDRIIVNLPGATAEVATLKQALSEAEDKASKERAERERQEARVGEVQQELQALVTKHEALELDLKTRESELATALESAKSAKAEAQKALQEIDAMKKIAAGKAFYMQSKHVKVNYLLLTESGALQEHSQICPTVCRMPHSFTRPRREAQRRSCSGPNILGPNTRCL